MSRKNKLQKFDDIRQFPNVFECYNVQEPTLTGAGMEVVDYKGRWARDFFQNNHPITLELACGAGEYAVGLAAGNPNRNYIGVDLKGNRLWKGAKMALEQQQHNVAFLRTRIEVIHHFFAPGEVDELWITFPDPFPRPSKSNRRLTSPWFLQLYRRILRPGTVIHVKHDDPDFYRFTLDTITAEPDCALLYHNPDIYAAPLADENLALKTKYEIMHLAEGRKITYIRFRLGHTANP
ncbi:MAG: tRNA (guanosine(46)-N7)-methyltransferase TrmB [Saprospiraceae bacterium]|nr:tRNA (guanosine(46)-N7)-methyltransferase TrmB [Saprospiraceae bacterium]